MRYQGGKSRIAKQIAEVINAVYGWEIPNSKTNSVAYHSYDGGGGDRQHLLVYSVGVAPLKVEYEALIASFVMIVIRI